MVAFASVFLGSLCFYFQEIIHSGNVGMCIINNCSHLHKTEYVTNYIQCSKSMNNNITEDYHRHPLSHYVQSLLHMQHTSSLQCQCYIWVEPAYTTEIRKRGGNNKETISLLYIISLWYQNKPCNQALWLKQPIYFKVIYIFNSVSRCRTATFTATCGHSSFKVFFFCFVLLHNKFVMSGHWK